MFGFIKGKIRFIAVVIFIILVIIATLSYDHYVKVYQSLDVDRSDVSVVEYGTANYNIKELVSEPKGTTVTVKKDIDTSKVGVQVVVLELKKEDVSKLVEVEVEVKDTVFPTVEIEKEEITVNTGDGYDLLSNIKSVNDKVDGELDYNKDDVENGFKIESTYNPDVAGNYDVKVIAVDKSGNKTEKVFSIKVIDRELTKRIVNIAKSFVGYPYVYGGNSPTGFDCSGFVQYVYKQLGINVSRSANTQIYDGYAVSYSEIQPGDIINWGYSNGVVTHSALYIGDGKMIHATNPSWGVIISDVQGWINGSDVGILGVRRVI